MDATDPFNRPQILPFAAVALAAAVGLGLIIDAIPRSSATYDEVEYLEIGSRWWRTGEQATISRMGSPLTFWKLQQAPVLALLDRTGRGRLIDAPILNQAELLPLIRYGGLWIWLAAFGLTAEWARRWYGRWAMAAAAWWFALSPNLLAHGGLATMELPVTAAWAASWLLFAEFLLRGRRWAFVGSAALAGLAFSCKFTAVLLPPLLGLAWLVDRWGREGWRVAGRATAGMAAFVVILLAADLAVTGGARLAPSPRTGAHPSLDGRWGPPIDGWIGQAAETPWPADWVGFLNQTRHQKSGGSSYLLGQRRERGWWYYYLVALAVKCPPMLGLVLIGRLAWRPADPLVRRGGRMIGVGLLGFLLVTAIGSSRNYGVRYLLPLAPLAIVWLSGLASGPRWARWLIGAGLIGQAAAVATIHPHELSYFNGPAGGPRGGRRILADSNLDWGQGARALAALQAAEPGYRDLTLFYFGDTDPGHYGVVGRRHVIDAHADHPGLPPTFGASTAFVAVSSSLQFGPWGPAGYFDRLGDAEPVLVLVDGTVAIYRTRPEWAIGSEEVAAATEPPLEAVGELGHPEHERAGLDRR